MISPTDHPPVIAVLVGDDGGRPPHLEPLDGRVHWRFTDAAGLAEAVRGADALLLWDFFSSALADAWPHCDRLRWVHVAAAGVDTLLFDDLRSSRVVVTNARGTFDRPIAEFVAMSVLAHAKRTHESAALQRERTWRHREPRAVVGTRALVVGTGAIGREIARLLRALGVEVHGAGSRARPGYLDAPPDGAAGSDGPARSDGTDRGGETDGTDGAAEVPDADFATITDSAQLAQHVAEVDYLINAAPLTSATRGLIDAAVFAAIKPGAHLINIGRGPTVVEADLLAALETGRLDGASLDVVDTEPLPPDSPLWTAPGVVITPHMSGDVVGWRDTLARQFVDNAERWLEHRPLRNVVDKHLGYVPTGTN